MADETSFYYSLCKFYRDGLTSALECEDTQNPLFSDLRLQTEPQDRKSAILTPYYTHFMLMAGASPLAWLSQWALWLCVPAAGVMGWYQGQQRSPYISPNYQGPSCVPFVDCGIPGSVLGLFQPKKKSLILERPQSVNNNCGKNRSVNNNYNTGKNNGGIIYVEPSDFYENREGVLHSAWPTGEDSSDEAVFGVQLGSDKRRRENIFQGQEVVWPEA